MPQITVDAREFANLADVYEQAGRRAPLAIARALNHTGNKARTQVARDLAAQAGVGYGIVKDLLKTKQAFRTDLDYEVSISGKHISLKEFNARQQVAGVAARPWNARRVFPHTFIVDRLGGHVFRRAGDKRLPIVKLWGPSLPVEMLRGQTAEGFQKMVKAELPARLVHELQRIFPTMSPSGAPQWPSQGTENV